ncbi:MAG: hypothetical protein LBS62_13550 [Clostridiales bacterium]|nr:hypothetical protein [Clostridiales bacterium]
MKKRLKAILKRIAVKSVEPFPSLRNAVVELAGYIEYATLKRKFGVNCVIGACAWEGTGDYYICGMYANIWTNINYVNNLCFICKDKAKENIMALFPSMQVRTYIPERINNMYYLRFLAKFCGIDFHWFQYNSDDPKIARGVMQQAPPGALSGYKGFEILDSFIYGGFSLPRDITPEIPQFDYDLNKIDALFAQVSAVQGKTVLIAPYSASLRGLEPPQEFWIQIVGTLQSRGYSMLTNCAGKEQPLPNTKPLLVPYALSVPFLNAAGGFIGIRSGLCDIISTTTAKKIILYPYEAIYWPDGMSLAFTGLNHMGLCDDAVELEFAPMWANMDEITKKVLEQFE